MGAQKARADRALKNSICTYVHISICSISIHLLYVHTDDMYYVCTYVHVHNTGNKQMDQYTSMCTFVHVRTYVRMKVRTVHVGMYKQYTSRQLVWTYVQTYICMYIRISETTTIGYFSIGILYTYGTLHC